MTKEEQYMQSVLESVRKESEISDGLTEELQRIEKDLKENIKPLDSEISKMVDDNFWDLV